MKSIIPIISLLLIPVLSNAVVVPSDAVEVTGSVNATSGSYLVKSGSSVSFNVTSATIFVESGGEISSINGTSPTIYLETGASLGSVSAVSPTILRDQTFTADPGNGTFVFNPGDNVDQWAYFSTWPWIYADGQGWYFCSATEDGLWLFPSFDGGSINLLAN